MFVLLQQTDQDPPSTNQLGMLEVAVAVKVGQRYLSGDHLKESFYLNKTLFARSGFQLYSYDFWDEYMCGRESCKNLQRCSIYWTKAESGKQLREPIRRPYVVFSGIYLKPNLQCKCPHTFHGTQCDKEFNMCFAERCNKNGECVSTDDGFTCVCDKGYTGKQLMFLLNNF